MKSKFMKKTLAAALALTIVGGGLPTLTGGTDIFKSAIVANAEEEAIIPAVGVTIKFGEIFKCVKDHDKHIPYYFTCDGEKTICHAYDDDNSKLSRVMYLPWINSWGIAFDPSSGGINWDYGCTATSFVDDHIVQPDERHFEEPTGVKIVSGTGTESDPFKLELAYEGDPIPLETDVKVGKKWYIGDTISTDAVFSVTSRYFDYYICERQLETITTKLRGKKLPKCITSTVEGKTGADFDDVTIGDPYGDDASSIFFSGYDDTVKGIEIVGGSGTEEDPFTLAPILAKQPEFKTNSMTLGGAISMNFYIDLSGVPEEWRDLSYVEFTVNGKKQTAKFDPNKMNSSKTAYGFTCMLNSISMADDVKATLYYYDSDGIKQSVSTTSTAETYLKKFNSNDTEKLWNLIKGINDYGYYMQKYLSKAAASPWTLGVDHKAMSTAYTKAPTYQLNRDTYLSEMANLKKEATPSSDIERFNYALSLDSDTSLIVKIKPKSTYKGSISVKVTDASGKTTTVTPTKLSDGRYQITINNISAHKLADMYTVTVKTTNGTSTFKASALTYAYEGIQLLSEGDEYNAMCALYEYYKTSKAYKG